MKIPRLVLAPLLVVLAAAAPASRARAVGLAGPGAWNVLEPGLELGTFRVRSDSDAGDPAIRVLRIDPGRFRLRLLSASAPDQGEGRSAREWVARHDLVAAINASMYQEDLRTSVSLMRSADHVNNPRLSRDMAVLAFDRRVEGVPEVQIIDRECQDLEALRHRYGTLVQSIRMLSCTGENVWAQQPRRSSSAAIGTDDAGRVLLIHSGAIVSTHDLVELLRALPIGLRRCMYAEGGSEAQLYVRAGGREAEFVGAYRSGAGLGGEPLRAPRIPNVVGVERREAPGAPDRRVR